MENTACQRNFQSFLYNVIGLFYVCFGFCVFWTVGDSCVGTILVEDDN